MESWLLQTSVGVQTEDDGHSGVDDAGVHPPGVQIDAAIKLVLSTIESHVSVLVEK